MKSVNRAMLCAAAAVMVAAAPASAQQQYQQVVSANPFGLLLEWFNAEYERVITESATAGVGGSYAKDGGITHTNADAFVRFYPQGTPLEGWAFGAKIGITKPDADEGPYFGYGFDVNRSWLLGRNRNFYVGVGFGLKRLVGVEEELDEFGNDETFDLKYVPTFRIVNIGIAF